MEGFSADEVHKLVKELNVQDFYTSLVSYNLLVAGWEVVVPRQNLQSIHGKPAVDFDLFSLTSLLMAA